MPKRALVRVHVYVRYMYIVYSRCVLMCVLAECCSFFEVSQSGW